MALGEMDGWTPSGCFDRLIDSKDRRLCFIASIRWTCEYPPRLDAVRSSREISKSIDV